MIVKFDNVHGERLAGLIAFVHSKENEKTTKAPPPAIAGDHLVMVVIVKKVNPVADSSYELTLDILEQLMPSDGSTEPVRHVAPLYFTKVYELLRRDVTE